MGGRPWFGQDGGKKFTDVLFRYYPKEVKLAFCIFAQPESNWEETRKWNTDMFDKFKGGRKISYQTMTPENFAEVSAWADIIYMPGGDTTVLWQKLQPCGDLAKLWEGKVIAGSSAGMNVLCEGYITLTHKQFGRGLGWVPVTAIPHWRSDYEGYTDPDWDEFEQDALRNLPNKPVFTIPESEFAEFTVA